MYIYFEVFFLNAIKSTMFLFPTHIRDERKNN